jgi:PAS domain S-box-containing protein
MPEKNYVYLWPVPYANANEKRIPMTINTASLALYRTIFSASSEGMAIVGPHTCFIEVNAAFGQLFAKEPEQIVGMRCIELFGREDAWVVVQAVQEQRAIPSIEISCNINGSRRLIGLKVTPVQGADEALCLIVAYEVADQEDAGHRQVNFLATLAHELRSPLNTMHGYLDLALMGVAGELNEQQREFVQRARASSEHLYALLEDVLLISRAEIGQVRLNRDVVNLQNIITDAVEELEVTASDHAVTIDVQLPSDLPPLYADAVRMQHVLRNLVSNALHFTPAGGQITISASITHEESGFEIAPGIEAQKLLKLQVSDTGSGLAADALEHIFERFYQVSGAMSRSASGQGLGLAIVKMIVELHGGQVTVVSSPDQGSTFTCLLPCLLS